ncbi:MAG: type II toxin-antitoxin system prevent-host-death family antitoxin [Candidatus Nitricoxidivorans perseverans]|uniref:Type II toxin-antitoxin system prevent-host-death family antitoxin n=1 Tax=Candidatus Nitricoxidivorans perseverans TaxID=2975601 RepID=A0AA49J1B4_9PROT|nr:MAG: type II toxin-antitoxin system prevent-host-death family antitoxin [Candidatus Nitricoxidivorans perseverans]
MRTVTIREAREGLSHPEQLFADNDEVVVMRRGEPIARILPIAPAKPRFRSLAAFRASQKPLDPALSQTVVEDREDRC